MDRALYNKLRRLRPLLLAWYDVERRKLPWREHASPYRVLVSEFMLQQTQVDKVVPYYQRFLRSFPSFRQLALASVDDVLQMWAGLGYYSRARNLHRCAQIVTERHKGQLPQDELSLRALPGIGPYTAAAVLSIAYAVEIALVDGNVDRVLCRVLALSEHPAVGASNSPVHEAAQVLVPGERPGDFNQALMELGALVCRPGQPACPQCPLTQGCAARRQGIQHLIPAPRVRNERSTVHVAAGLVEYQGCYLLTRRPEKGLFGGLWELPTVEVGETHRHSGLRQRVERLLNTEVSVGGRLATLLSIPIPFMPLVRLNSAPMRVLCPWHVLPNRVCHQL
jgi:A/G-specific adenine glycosylase